MEPRANRRVGSNDTRDAVQAFYNRHPYPPPVGDLEGYRRRWQDEGRRRADFHLHWPGKTYRTDLRVLVAGCGTSQAAKHAVRQPGSHVVGIDISELSVRHTEALKRKHDLTNLDVYQLPIERVGELGSRFDKIVCTGVLHHLPDPEAGLRALQEVLEPDGAVHLMIYAAYGRIGVYMLQEYCLLLGIGHDEKDIQELAITLTDLPREHPLAHLLGESPDFQTRDGLADALLNPQDRAYTVRQLFDLIESCGLAFGRWFRQAPYLPRCGSLAATPHAARLAELPPREQFATVELFRGTMLRHNLIVYQEGQGAGMPRFDREGWQAYVPLRLPEAISLQNRLPPGAAAVLVNQAHRDTDLTLQLDTGEMRLFDAIDGNRTIAEIVHRISQTGGQGLPERAHSLFERLWWYDQVVFDTTRKVGNGAASAARRGSV